MSPTQDEVAFAERMNRRREHLMSEITAPAPARNHRSAGSRGRAITIAALAAVAVVGGGAVAAQAINESEPNVVEFDRYEVSCSASWDCVAGAAKAFGHSVLAPTDAEPVGRLAALSSADSPVEVLGYGFTPSGSSAEVQVDARSGVDSAMRAFKPPAAAVAAGADTRVAGQPVYIVERGEGSAAYVSVAGMHYVVTSDLSERELRQVVLAMKPTAV